MRERRFIIQLTITDIRITPARAGKTCREWYSGPRYGDHPRSCGKDKEVPDWILNLLGSPPLVRERLIAILVIYPHQGITPARAGKTCRSVNRGCIFRDHPRSCGKDDDTITFLQVNRGSPPLVRERLIVEFAHHRLVGITPARAGKTMRDKFTEWLVQDHPRSCGKDWCKISYAAQIGGSPPLVRERLLELAIGCANHGITPARAGKTASTITTETDGGDHPRSCGKDL